MTSTTINIQSKNKTCQEVEDHLDKKIKRVDVDTYKFNFGKDHDFGKISEIAKNHKHLLNHPVNEAYILTKWGKIRWKLRMNFGIYLVFLWSLTILVQMSYWKLLPNGKKFCIAC